jgi:hypothetical protein
VTLADDLVERYSRQILLPEVGGRGQERLCATTVEIAGDTDLGDVAADLLAAAGLRVVRSEAPDGLVIGFDARRAVLARRNATHAVVVTAVGRPCRRCADRVLPPLPAGETSPASAQLAGALAAAEALRVALGLATGGRVHTIDLASGRFGAQALATPPCPACEDAE